MYPGLEKTRTERVRSGSRKGNFIGSGRSNAYTKDVGYLIDAYAMPVLIFDCWPVSEDLANNAMDSWSRADDSIFALDT